MLSFGVLPQKYLKHLVKSEPRLTYQLYVNIGVYWCSDVALCQDTIEWVQVEAEHLESQEPVYPNFDFFNPGYG